MRNTQLTSGLFFIGIAVLLLVVLIPYGVDAPKKVKYAALHPAYYPRIVAYCLLLLGALIAVMGLRRQRDDSITASSTADQAASQSSMAASNVSPAKPIIILALVFLAVFFALPFLGFPLATALTLLFIMPFAGEKRWWLVGVVAIVLPMLLYLFFVKIANIPIPGGVLEPWLLQL